MAARLSFICISVFVLACLVTPAAQASGLGRLFFTPEQRSQLDYAHARDATNENGAASILSVNGIVQKMGGGRTVWINGVAQNAGISDERSPDSLPVAVPGKSKPVKVKVGQRLLLDQPAPQTLIEPGK
jgi:hypothetical protein